MYLASAGGLLALYYLALVLWLYRHRMQRLLQAGRQPAPTLAGVPGGSGGNDLSYEELTKVASQIRHGILTEAGKNASKPDLLRRIHAVLASRGGLRQPASRGALNQYIVQQAHMLSGVSFTEAELEQAWIGLFSEEGTVAEAKPDVSQVNP